MAIDPANYVIASSAGAAQTNTATLAASTGGQRTYLGGFVITGSGATGASVIDITITGLLGGTVTMKLPVPAGATAVMAPLAQHYSVPLPSSAVNTAIAVSSPSFGAGNLHASVMAYGFYA